MATNTVFSLKETVKSWDDDYYHPIAEQFYDAAIGAMLRMMDVPPGARVLDAGCGPGVHSVRVARQGHRVTAIDISPVMLQEARRRVENADVGDRVEFAEEDLTRLSFADQSFRYVFSWGVLIHIQEMEKAMDELARIVEPGGKLALFLTNRRALDYRFENFARFVFRKPLDMRRLPMGDGICYDMHGERLWLWRNDLRAVNDYLAGRGFHQTHRTIGALSEMQRRVGGIARRFLLRCNNAAYSMHLPAALGVTNLLVFEKAR